MSRYTGKIRDSKRSLKTEIYFPCSGVEATPGAGTIIVAAVIAS